MTDALALHVLRRPDLEAASIYSSWVDGDRLARPSPAKREMMLDNPLSIGPDEPMQIIGTKGSRVIGRIDLIAGRLLVADQATPILWGSEFFVPDADRSTMMGAMLLLRCQQMYHTLGAHGPSQMAYPLYSKLKWIDVPYQRYVIMSNSRPVVRRYVHAGAAGLAHRVANVGLLGHKAYMGALRAQAAANLAARHVPEMPAELDSALRPASSLIRGYRGVDWINWVLKHRFSDASRHERHLFLVQQEERSDPVGYFMLKVKFHTVATSRAYPDLTLASLVDAQSFSPEKCSHEAIVHLAFRETYRLNADALEVADRPGAREGFYRSIGALPAGLMHLMVRAAAPSPLNDPAYREPAQWDIQLGDGEYIPN